MAIPPRIDYETLIYGVAQNYAKDIQLSTLRLYSTSSLTARLQGEVFFENGLVLRVREYIDFRVNKIMDYSYTVYRGEDKIRWYDPQPHPENPSLATTFPHHFHEEPDPSTSDPGRRSAQSIKHNRKPAPGISFDAPNLPTLIADCIRLGEGRGLG